MSMFHSVAGGADDHRLGAGGNAGIGGGGGG